MFTEVVEGVLTAAKIYEERKTIAQMIARWQYKLVNGTSRICVFGAGGTGKSTLGLFLKGKLNTDQATGRYDETLTIERIKVAGKIPALLSIGPGQEGQRREATWPELFRELSSGKSSRIINICSYGYHASGLEHQAHRAYQAGASDDDFREAYFNDSRLVEISALRALVPHLSATPGRLRMITLVTKQDLWWAQRQEVRKFYEKGAYRAELEKIRARKGAANFQHDYLSCALIEQNLSTVDGFELAKTTRGYDDPLRVANLTRAAAAMTQMIGR